MSETVKIGDTPIEHIKAVTLSPEQYKQLERKAAAYDGLVKEFAWFMEQPPHDKIYFGMIHGRFRDAARIAAGEEASGE